MDQPTAAGQVLSRQPQSRQLQVRCASVNMFSRAAAGKILSLRLDAQMALQVRGSVDILSQVLSQQRQFRCSSDSYRSGTQPTALARCSSSSRRLGAQPRGAGQELSRELGPGAHLTTTGQVPIAAGQVFRLQRRRKCSP
jgi:hypothetical protein